METKFWRVVELRIEIPGDLPLLPSLKSVMPEDWEILDFHQTGSDIHRKTKTYLVKLITERLDFYKQQSQGQSPDSTERRC